MRLLCLRCREIVDQEGLTACPTCGSTKPPADADDTVTATLTRHELRILTFWASNYAASIKDHPDGGDAPLVITGILDHLAHFTDTALSLRQEIADVRSAFPTSNVTVHRNGKETDL